MGSVDRAIYLDHNATAPVLPVVRDAMLPWLGPRFGNPSSRDHAMGRAAATVIKAAAAALRRLTDCPDAHIVWTSGATESCNLAILGKLGHARHRGHVVSQKTEHPAVLDTVRTLGRHDHDVTLVNPSSSGTIAIDDVAAALRPDTSLVTVMRANNETGTLQPTDALADLCRQRGVALHVDATQALGRIPTAASGIDLFSGSCHKSGGPPGVGFLCIRAQSPPMRLAPQIHGGGHQGGLRSGTLNVPAIAGCGAWAAWWCDRVAAEAARLTDLRDALAQRITAALQDVVVHGAGAPRLPNTLYVSFRGLEAGAILERLPDVAASSGSACASDLPQASHVLQAMGVPPADLYGAIRLSAGWSTTAEDSARAADRIIHVVRDLRGI